MCVSKDNILLYILSIYSTVREIKFNLNNFYVKQKSSTNFSSILFLKCTNTICFVFENKIRF